MFSIETHFCKIIFWYSAATLQKKNGTESERVTQQHCMGTVSKASFFWVDSSFQCVMLSVDLTLELKVEDIY